MEPVCSMSPSVCCSTVLFRSSSWEHKLLFVALGYYSICLQRPLHLLPGGVFSCWFAAKASVPIGDLDPTAMIWTDASLELEGHGTFWETRAAPGSMGSF